MRYDWKNCELRDTKISGNMVAFCIDFIWANEIIFDN